MRWRLKSPASCLLNRLFRCRSKKTDNVIMRTVFPYGWGNFKESRSTSIMNCQRSPRQFHLSWAVRTGLADIPTWQILAVGLVISHHHKHIALHERHVVSNHRPFDCLFNSLCRFTSNKHRSPYYWPFVRGIPRWPVNSPHKEPVTRNKLLFDDVVMGYDMVQRNFNVSNRVWNIFVTYVLSTRMGKCFNQQLVIVI